MKKIFLILLLLFVIGCAKERILSPQECEKLGGRTLNIVGGSTCDENEENIGKVVGFISPNICCVEQGNFCGSSTYSECSIDTDCKIGGCSGQICGAEERIVTTCEYRDCYNAKAYNLECKCVDLKCQWS